MHIPQNELLLYKLFLSYPDRSFYMQEIGRILKKKPGVFQRTLNKIEEEGFIQSEFIANARFFKLNSGYPVLKELTSIIKKMYGALDIYSRDIEKMDQEAKAHARSLKESPKLHKNAPPVKKNTVIEPGSFQDMLKKKIAKVKSLKKQKAEETTLPSKPEKRSITLRDFQSEEMLSSLKKPETPAEDIDEIPEVPEKSEKKITPKPKKETAHDTPESPKPKKPFKKDLSSIWEEELKFQDAKKAQKKSALTKEQLELF